MRGVELVIFAAVFLWGGALALAVAVTCAERAIRRVTVAAYRLETLAADNRSVSDPKPEPGPVTADNLEPEDEEVRRRRSRRGYFA